MKYDKIETGVNLRQLRIENKLSPGEVSDIVDKSESHIMQLERGSRNLTVEMLCKFADVYNTDPNTILGISSQRMVVMIDKLKETFFINSFSVELIEPKTLPLLV